MGTLTSNRHEIAPEFLPNTTREVWSVLWFTSSLTRISCTKKRRSVLLLPSMHHSKRLDPDTNLPEINAVYSTTKSGVWIWYTKNKLFSYNWYEQHQCIYNPPVTLSSECLCKTRLLKGSGFGMHRVLGTKQRHQGTGQYEKLLN